MTRLKPADQWHHASVYRTVKNGRIMWEFWDGSWWYTACTRKDAVRFGNMPRVAAWRGAN